MTQLIGSSVSLLADLVIVGDQNGDFLVLSLQYDLGETNIKIVGGIGMPVRLHGQQILPIFRLLDIDWPDFIGSDQLVMEKNVSFKAKDSGIYNVTTLRRALIQRLVQIIVSFKWDHLLRISVDEHLMLDQQNNVVRYEEKFVYEDSDDEEMKDECN